MTYEEAKANYKYDRAIILIRRIKTEETHEREVDRHKAFDLAISALEKQIPKKVNISLKGTTDWNTKCRCPNCHSMVSHGKYCSNCGQALDWSDSE